MRTAPHYPESHVRELVELGQDIQKLQDYDIDQYVDMYVKK